MELRRSLLWIAGTWAGALVLCASPATAATINVTTTADVVANDGQCSLREAITAANTDTASGTAPNECPAGNGADLIILGPGTYGLTRPTPPGQEETNAGGDLDVSSPITIVGQGVNATYVTALGLDRVLDVRSGTSLTLKNLTVTGGVASPGAAATPATKATPGGSGGGIRSAGELALQDVTVAGNMAGRGGDDSTFNGVGAAGGSGGAIESTGPMLSIVDSTISTNLAGNGGSGNEAGGLGGQGGGVDSTSPSVTISGTTIVGNRAGHGGNGNFLHGSGGDGGGLELLNDATGNTTLTNTTIVGNSTGYYGDGRGPSPGAAGGALELRGTASVAGGAATLLNATIAQNTTDSGSSSGGDLQAYGALTIANVAIQGSCGGTLMDGGHNFHSANGGGCPGAAVDLELGSLADNGGPTQTMLPAAGSPLIDAVPSRGSECPASDQRGLARPQGRACDAGAVELRPVVLSFRPTRLTFRRTRIGQRRRQTVRLTYSNGEGPLLVGGAKVTGKASRDFKVLRNDCRGSRLAPGASCQLTIAFQPRKRGMRTVRLTIASVAPGRPLSLSVSGRAVR